MVWETICHNVDISKFNILQILSKLWKLWVFLFLLISAVSMTFPLEENYVQSLEYVTN